MESAEILEIKEIIKDSLSTILKYIGCSSYEIDECKSIIETYRTDKDEDKRRELTRVLNNVFFNTYTECVYKSLNSPSVPVPVQMFLLFGYMDEELAGVQNSIILCKLTESYNDTPRRNCVSLYEWLSMIYNGSRMPSMNDMSVDYDQELRERLKRREITNGEYEAELRDRNKKLEYEIRNAVSIMRRVSGQPTRFLAIFNEDSLDRPLNKSILVNKEVENTLDSISNIDVNIFNHEYTYSNPKAGIDSIRLQKEIKPDIILLPIIGSHPMMWQEIEGRNRQSAARFFYPKFLNGELRTLLIRNCGEYRWEYCKRSQGARWQDIGDPSICSYFLNYIQTYKKNHHISPEQKEKISNQYAKFRHNIKEIFVDDYIKFIANEAEGNIRLNKLSRGILMRFCVLNKDIRKELIKNSLYTEFLNVVNNRIEHDKKLLVALKKRIEDNGVSIPPEVREYEMLINR